jgi:hypothetical protein
VTNLVSHGGARWLRFQSCVDQFCPARRYGFGAVVNAADGAKHSKGRNER